MVNKRYGNVLLEETLSDAVDELRAQLPQFILHIYNQEQSQKCFHNVNVTASNENIVMQVDFAENYTCNYLNEIQASHWSNPQVALFTVVIWYGESKCDSYAVVSDNISHDRYCVDTFLRAVLDDHLSKNPSVTSLHVFSDRAASQFKQKYNFSNIRLLKNDYNLERFVWTFFASSHGKGAVDGIGAVVKRYVWNMVRSHKKVVRNAETFAEVCQNLKTSVIFVPLDITESRKSHLKNNWKDIRPTTVKGTQKIHQVTAVSPYVIHCKFHAMAVENDMICVNIRVSEDSSVSIPNEQDTGTANDNNLHQRKNLLQDDSIHGSRKQKTKQPTLGEWVAVIYDDQWLPELLRRFKMKVLL